LANRCLSPGKPPFEGGLFLVIDRLKEAGSQKGVFQMKNTFKLFGLIAILAVIGVSMTACPAVDEGDDGIPKTLIITGIGTTQTTTLTVGIADVDTKKKKTELVAYNQVSPQSGTFGDSVTIPLLSYVKGDGEPYTGTGDYFIVLIFDGPTTGDNDDITYMYTGTVGGTQPSKCSITKPTTTVAFNQFKQQ
jgi:hypothetical protein